MPCRAAVGIETRAISTRVFSVAHFAASRFSDTRPCKVHLGEIQSVIAPIGWVMRPGGHVRRGTAPRRVGYRVGRRGCCLTPALCIPRESGGSVRAASSIRRDWIPWAFGPDGHGAIERNLKLCARKGLSAPYATEGSGGIS